MQKDEQDSSVIVKSPSGSDKHATGALEGKTHNPIHPITATLFPSVTVEINGIQMPALLDAASPIAILNGQAAKQVGIETIALPSSSETSKNAFASMANKFKEANAMAKAAANSDVLAIAGTNDKQSVLPNQLKLLKQKQWERKTVIQDLRLRRAVPVWETFLD